MDTQAYISSGVIEAYVMGLASEEEIQILECVQKHNADVRQAIVDAQKAIEHLVTSQAVAPPVQLKSNIWAAIQAEEVNSKATLNEEVKFEAKSESIIESNSEKDTKIHTLEPKNRGSFEIKNYKSLAIAASVSLLVGVGVVMYMMQNQQNLQSQIAQLEQKNNQDQQSYAKLMEKWNISSNPDMKTIVLAGVNNHPGTKAIVYLDKTSKQTYLSVENLPACPAGHAYQLWAIVDGKPVDGGMYNSKDSIQKMHIIDNAQAFAITLEVEGGSAVPTMENMYVMGEV